MTAKLLKFTRPAKLECSACGATADAACDCGVSYVPAGERAAKAVAANPDKSNRAIAAEIGTDERTVRRARHTSTAANAAVESGLAVVAPPPVGALAPATSPCPTAPCDAVERRVGRDGKVRRLPQRRPARDDGEPHIEDEIDEDEDPENFRTAYLLRVDQAVRFAADSDFLIKKIPGPVTKEIASAARQAATAWSKLAQKLEKAL